MDINNNHDRANPHFAVKLGVSIVITALLASFVQTPGSLSDQRSNWLPSALIFVVSIVHLCIVLFAFIFGRQIGLTGVVVLSSLLALLIVASAIYLTDSWIYFHGVALLVLHC